MVDEQKTVPNPLDEHGEQSLLLIKPHATWMGSEAEIRMIVERNKFWVIAQERVVLTEEAVKQMMLEVDGYIDEGAITASIGASVFFVVAKDNAVQDLRKLCGDNDPGTARIGTLHRMYGVDRHANGVWAPKSTTEFAKAFAFLRTWRDLYWGALKEGEADAMGAADEYIKRLSGQSGEDEDVPAAEVEAAPAITEKVADSYSKD